MRHTRQPNTGRTDIGEQRDIVDKSDTRTRAIVHTCRKKRSVTERINSSARCKLLCYSFHNGRRIILNSLEPPSLLLLLFWLLSSSSSSPSLFWLLCIPHGENIKAKVCLCWGDKVTLTTQTGEQDRTKHISIQFGVLCMQPTPWVYSVRVYPRIRVSEWASVHHNKSVCLLINSQYHRDR